MLRISKLADYATMIMTVCARVNEHSYTAKKLAEETRLQLPTVSKILKLLLKQGLLVSQRGAQGGYQLAKPAREISMAEVIAAVDGPIALTECNHAASQCGLMKSCATKYSWQLINLAIHEALSNISLADMIEQQFQPKLHIKLPGKFHVQAKH